MEVDESTLNRNLPAELWREIFEKVPKKERQNISQVNSFFYKIICDMEAFQRMLVVTQEKLNEGIEMLLWSKRKIKKINFQNIHFDMGNLALMIEILEVHGATIKIMDISNEVTSVETNISLLIKFFQLTPKLKNLIWSVRNVKLTNHFDENVLPKLKNLVLTCSDDLAFGFATMFTPGTIEELTVNSNWIHLESFISRQTSINRLHIMCKYDNMRIFNCLKLEALSVLTEHNAIEFMKLHPELELIFALFAAKRTTLKMIEAYCQMEKLQHFVMKVDGQNIHEIHRVSALKNLMMVYFILHLDDPSQFLQMTTIKLDNLKAIKIEDSEFTVLKNSLFLETAGINWPKLKVLFIDVPPSFNNGILLLNEYFDNFKNLEKLYIYSKPEINLDELEDMKGQLLQNTSSFISYFQQYPNIKLLQIHDANITHFCDLLSALPNLEHLEVKYEYGIDYTPRCLQELSRLKKLKEIKVKFSALTCKHFSEQEAAWLKKLCQCLRRFGIEFVGTVNFHTTLRNQIGSCDFIEAESVGNGLKLSNFEY